MNQLLKEFIKQNINEDTYDLAAKGSSLEPILLKKALEQIEARQKIKMKVPIWYDNFDLQLPNSKYIEQASSQLTAIYKANLLDYRKSLDCTGGTGIDSYFMSSRSNYHVIVENNTDLANLLRYNFEVLGIRNIEVINCDVVEYLRDSDMYFDIIYIDPSRRTTNRRTLSINEFSPKLDQILPFAKSHAKRILIKLSPMFDIDEALRIFSDIEEVHVVGVDNECKELLVILHKDTFEPKLVITELGAKGSYRYELALKKKERFYKEPSTYIYEPDNIIIKAGKYFDYYERFGLREVGQSTFLFTSDNLIDDFPGNIFELIDIAKVDRNEIKKMLGANTAASVKSRNFPLTSEILRQKLKLKSSDNNKIFATTLINKEKKLLFCKKISLK